MIRLPLGFCLLLLSRRQILGVKVPRASSLFCSGFYAYTAEVGWEGLLFSSSFKSTMQHIELISSLVFHYIISSLSYHRTLSRCTCSFHHILPELRSLRILNKSRHTIKKKPQSVSRSQIQAQGTSLRQQNEQLE